MNSAQRELLRELGQANVRRRRKAVVRIRKSREKRFGEHLLETLREESRETWNWEIRYHLIMALGELGYRPACPFLRGLSLEETESTLLYTALGEALVRLGRTFDNDPAPLIDIVERGNLHLTDGAFRAVWLLHLCFDRDDTRRILAATLGKPRGEARVREAWPPEFESFYFRKYLKACLTHPSEEIRKDAESALYGTSPPRGC